MQKIQYFIARTRAQLDDALRVRFKVFGEEMGLLGAQSPLVPREINAFDTLSTTTHFIAYAGAEPIATVRLLLPNPEVARETGDRFGIDLESKFDLSPLFAPGVVLAETTRFCVRREWRGSGVVMQLYEQMREESLRQGVTHWVASANTETDSMEDAVLIHKVAQHLGLVRHPCRVSPKIKAPPPAVPSAPYYTPEERRRGHGGDFTGLRLPRTLSLFAYGMGARFTGEPIYDPHFRRFSIPLLVSLGERGRCRPPRLVEVPAILACTVGASEGS